MTTTAQQPSTSPGAAFTQVMSTVLGVTAGKLTEKTDNLINRLNGVASGGVEEMADAGTDAALDQLDEAAESGGAKQQAGAQGLRAGLEGKNPITAAIKGAWAGGSPSVRAAIVTAGVSSVLLAVLSPVLLLVYLLSLLIVAAVMKAQPEKKQEEKKKDDK